MTTAATSFSRILINIDGWQKVPKPDWFVETENQKWDQLTGLFINSPVGLDSHIDNMEGNQALYLFAVPSVGLFQDYDSVDYGSPSPTHNLTNVFEVGKSYRLTAGLIGGGGGMQEGATLMISLYYRQGPDTPVTVAFNNVIHSKALFPTTTNFVDVEISTPVVKSTDPWVGKPIGVSILSTIQDPGLSGGYWDVDNIRIEALPGPPAPKLAYELSKDGIFKVSWPTVIGFRYQLRSSEDLKNWSDVGQNVSANGQDLSSQFVISGIPNRFFTVVVTPEPPGGGGSVGESGWNVFSLTMTMSNVGYDIVRPFPTAFHPTPGPGPESQLMGGTNILTSPNP